MNLQKGMNLEKRDEIRKKIIKFLLKKCNFQKNAIYDEKNVLIWGLMFVYCFRI